MVWRNKANNTGLSLQFNPDPDLSMKSLAIAYVATLVSFLAIDAVWLGVIAGKLYREKLGDLMLPSPKLGIAAIFYLFFAVAIVILAIKPGLDAGSLWVAIGSGALLGLAAYGTYDITNLSTLKNWPASLVVIDMIWGTVLTGVASACGYIAARAMS
jgi:uncharacterized membrane protein